MKDTDVLIEGNLIKEIGTDIEAPSGAHLIDADGRTMIPGLIDAHWHVTYAYTPASVFLLNQGDILEVAIRSMTGAKETLLRGFTTVRDPGGNPFAIKKLNVINEVMGRTRLALTGKLRRIFYNYNNQVISQYENLNFRTEKNG